MRARRVEGKPCESCPAATTRLPDTLAPCTRTRTRTRTRTCTHRHVPGALACPPERPPPLLLQVLDAKAAFIARRAVRLLLAAHAAGFRGMRVMVVTRTRVLVAALTQLLRAHLPEALSESAMAAREGVRMVIPLFACLLFRLPLWQDTRHHAP